MFSRFASSVFRSAPLLRWRGMVTGGVILAATGSAACFAAPSPSPSPLFGMSGKVDDKEVLWNSLSFLGPGLFAEVWKKRHEQVTILEIEDGSAGEIVGLLLTQLRSSESPPAVFRSAVYRLFHFLVEFAITKIDNDEGEITDCAGYKLEGVALKDPNVQLCAVGLDRRGDSKGANYNSLVDSLSLTWSHMGALTGSLHIDYAGPDSPPVISKVLLPKEITSTTVLLVDSQCRTARTAISAIETLKAAGVEEGNIIYLCLIASPEGLEALCKAAPEVQVLTAAMGHHNGPANSIVPGLGSTFGARYFNKK